MSRRTGTGAVVALVAGREVNQWVRAKPYLITTAAIVVIILAIGFAARIAGGEDEPITVAVAEPVPSGFTDALVTVAAPLDRDVVVVPAASASEARQALQDGDVDIAVLGGDRTVVFDGPVDAPLLAVVQQAWGTVETRQSLLDAGLSEAQVDEAGPIEVLVRLTDPVPGMLAFTA